jgi:hypothetical protein
MRVIVAPATAGALIALATAGVGPAQAASPRVLLVGSFHGKSGTFTSIQAAVDAAQPGDWVLVGPGDYKESTNDVPTGAKGDDRAGGAVLITKPGLHLRGMDRNSVMIDGTKPGSPQCSSKESDQDFGPNDPGGKPTGRNGIVVFKAENVSVDNLSACNFLTGNDGGGNQIWFDGGAATGTQGLGAWYGSYLSATSTFYKDGSSPAGGYGIYVSNTHAPGGVYVHTYASNMNDSSYYVGACPDCNAVLDDAHGAYSALGYSGTNSGGHIVVKNSEFDNNQDGFDTNSQNNDDAPSPQDGACPHGATNPQAPPNIQRKTSCWVFTHNYVHDNNNPNVPAKGAAAAGPVGTGMSISGGRHNIVTDNVFANNGAWGLILVPYPDTENPPEVANCRGGTDLSTAAQPLCYFDDYANEIANNKFTHNGFFGNQTNGDVAEISGYNPNSTPDSNCWHDNIDTAGQFTSDPANINSHNTCGQTYQSNTLVSPFGVQVTCDSQLLGPCPSNAAANYPRATQVVLPPLPAQKTMPDPCAGVPANPWCVTTTKSRKHRRHKAATRKHRRHRVDPDHDGDTDRRGAK